MKATKDEKGSITCIFLDRCQIPLRPIKNRAVFVLFLCSFYAHYYSTFCFSGQHTSSHFYNGGQTECLIVSSTERLLCGTNTCPVVLCLKELSHRIYSFLPDRREYVSFLQDHRSGPRFWKQSGPSCGHCMCTFRERACKGNWFHFSIFETGTTAIYLQNRLNYMYIVLLCHGQTHFVIPVR